MKRHTPLNVLQAVKPLILVSALYSFSLFAIAANAAGGKTFASPQEAVDALVAAVKDGNPDGITAVLGPEGRTLASSGDAVADKAARERFDNAYSEAHTVRQVSNTRAVLVIGNEDYPFPIPIVAKDGNWQFDTAAGAEEILDRRIGENELAAIEVLRACVDAEHEYADLDRDGKGAQYARKILSSEGKRDGLYWPTAEGEPEPPLGPLVAYARAEGYRKRSSAPEPYHGYVFRILTAQGKDAAGGAKDYIVNGRMIGGFGFVAAPAEYGNSGVMTFVVNQDGTVFQKDLGPDTSRLAAGTTVFNPDSGWREIASD